MKIAAILLAAGSSRRFGEENKLLLNVEGMPMVARSAGALLKAMPPLRPIVVVTGYEQERMRDALNGMSGEEGNITFTHNPDYASGIASSVHAGLRALPGDMDGVVIALADMPWVESRHIEKLLEAFGDKASICIPMVDGRRGNPTLWGASYFERMYACEGDVGARALLLEYAACVREVAFEDAATLTDIDTPEGMAHPF
ncbi:MAG: nucleotidyltransferase family protein [Hyphomicrobiales bacterium]|nr:nucleotidyltransferase family protein [Hyphomicrobiales bacterium]